MEEDSIDKIFAVVPPAPDHNPVKQAVARAEELGENATKGVRAGREKIELL